LEGELSYTAHWPRRRGPRDRIGRRKPV